MTSGAGPGWGKWYLSRVCVGTTGTGSPDAQAKVTRTGLQQPPAWGPEASRRNMGDYLDGSQP